MYGAERVGGARMRRMVGEEGGPTSRMRVGRGGGGEVGGGLQSLWVARQLVSQVVAWERVVAEEVS